MTISLWESRENVLAVEARAAELNSKATRTSGMAVSDVTGYEVVLQG